APRPAPPRDDRLETVSGGGLPRFPQQLLAEVARRYGADREEPLVESAQGEPVSLQASEPVAQVENVPLAEVVGDRLRGPLRVAVDGAARGVAGGRAHRVFSFPGAGVRHELHVLEIVPDRILEAHPSRME